MKSIAIALIALMAAACATNPAPTPSSGASSPSDRPVTGLPPQTLPVGACGLFLFERRSPNRFVVFENINSRTVKIVHDGAVHELGVTGQGGTLVIGETFRRVYLDPVRNITFTLTGEVGEETGSGPRLENVLLSVRSLDGTRVVRPLGGVRSCGEEAG